MAAYDFFHEVSEAEKGGFGIWYEYLAKSRIFKKIRAKKVVIFGLPKKYSLGLDTLFFADKSDLHIVDDKKQSLEKYNLFAKNFSKKINAHFVDKLSNFKTKEKYDILISTEVLQDEPSLLSVAKNFAKILIIFVPNKKGYAHPRISGLKSMSIDELKKKGEGNGLSLVDFGYIDCPPWPAGACLPKEGSENSKESFFLKIIKKILNKITPLLAKFDRFYPPPWRELNSHMVYCIFKNGI